MPTILIIWFIFKNYFGSSVPLVLFVVDLLHPFNGSLFFLSPEFSLVEQVEYSLAFALSQMFSPKQKELFKKRLEELPLTKTEQEYYSRSVKKKVVALANAELHGLARKLLEK